MTKKDHDVLIQLCQKVDDLANSIRSRNEREEPLIKLITTHEEKLAWLQKGMVGSLSMGAAAILGIAVEVFKRAL